ncbi:hypothetical protein [Paenibacillus qinlingensis]|uniref:hypothetical protein n=1 Tax=Paenibacillus qinlingensis TaxID=1837343 RepID=UPI0015669F11|nr:hypothetical protein [Paenibacillus qinlingensis]NQX60363.1 hypothetical protein [Paenibacillus qinlingensis]
MENEPAIKQRRYSRPRVLSQQPVRFETAQSWNKGHGNTNHNGNGNGGSHYPNQPYGGPHNGNGKH